MKGLRDLNARIAESNSDRILEWRSAILMELGEFGSRGSQCDSDGIGRIRLGVHTTARFDRTPRCELICKTARSSALFGHWNGIPFDAAQVETAPPRSGTRHVREHTTFGNTPRP